MLTNFDQLPDSAFIRQRELIDSHLVPFSAATLWRKCKKGTFPTPLKLPGGGNITAWRVGDVRNWMLEVQS